MSLVVSFFISMAGITSSPVASSPSTSVLAVKVADKASLRPFCSQFSTSVRRIPLRLMVLSYRFRSGNIAASFVAGPVADRWGRKGGMVYLSSSVRSRKPLTSSESVCSKYNPSRCTLCSLPNKVPWSDMDNQGISTVTAAQSRIYLFFGRFLLGFGSTMNTSSALVPLSNYRLACRLIHWHRPAYVVEISPPQVHI